MPLETASFISDLVPSNPAGTDQLANADEHLRLLKAVLKAQFPNFTEAVTKTADEINNPPSSVPAGCILAWYGSSGSIPAGWALCNGQVVGALTTPDLRERTIVGAGTIAPQGTTAGATTASGITGASGAHTHTLSGLNHTHTGDAVGHALSEAELPAHKHANGVCDGQPELFNHGYTTASPTGGYDPQSDSGSAPYEGWTSTVGSGNAHTHSLDIASTTPSGIAAAVADHTHSTTLSTIQPSYGLHWIMKIED